MDVGNVAASLEILWIRRGEFFEALARFAKITLADWSDTNGSDSLPFEPPEQENIRLREKNTRLPRLSSS
jgi:hypothetical protein